MKHILFSGEMVRARRAGRKTQTRRAVKSVPPADYSGCAVAREYLGRKESGKWGAYFGWSFRACPYGRPGEVLAVKEDAWMWCAKVIHGLTRKTKQPKVNWMECRNVPPVYCADRAEPPEGVPEGMQAQVGNLTYEWRKKIGRFLPAWAVRDFIEVVSVRVERLQDISAADAIAEGLRPDHNWDRWNSPTGRWTGFAHTFETPVEAYQELWEAINGTGSWELNPWVWVVEFRERAGTQGG